MANCPISLDDAKNMFRLLEQDVAVLKGKTVRRDTSHVASNQTIPVDPDILRLHKSVTLCIDIFYVDGLPFLLTVSRNIRYFTINALNNR